MSFRKVRWIGIGAALSFFACTYRPARFSDAAPVLDARDDAPEPPPRRRGVPEPVYIAETYLHRPIQEGLRANRFPDAADVNSMDEVVRSTWFSPREVDARAVSAGPPGSNPPQPPLLVLPDPTVAVDGGLSVIDAKGTRYELGIDRPERPEMRTAAAVIGARLGWALGYFTPPSCIARLGLSDFVIGEAAHRSDGSVVDVEKLLWRGPPPTEGKFRVSAVAWPPGIDLGSTPEVDPRGDDPNDRISHRDRRTLRVLGIVASWLKIEGMGIGKTHDVYEGPSPAGHMVHYLIGWDDSLGAGSVVEPSEANRPPSEDGVGGPWFNLVTFGLVPPSPPRPTQTRWGSIGDFEEEVSPSRYRPSTPYEPVDRLLLTDAYWIAKRMAGLSPLALAAAIDAGGIADASARDRLLKVLQARRAQTVRYWFSLVTPLEVERVRPRELVLRDEAIEAGYERSAATRYLLEYMDSDGSLVLRRVKIDNPPGRFRLVIPPAALEQARDYLVVRLTATHNGAAAPRSFEAHLKRTGDELRVVGVRH